MIAMRGRQALTALLWLIWLLLPAWLRWQKTPSFLPDLYVSRHVLLLPMLAAVVLWLMLRAPGWREFRASRWRLVWALALLALAGWAALSTTWAYAGEAHPEVGATAALQFAVVAGFALVMACAGPGPRALIIALVIGLALIAALTVAQVLAGRSLGLATIGEFPFGPQVQRGSILRAGDLTYYRPSGLMAHPNMNAGLLMAGTLAASALWFDRRRWLQVLGGVLAAAGFSALLLTFSRAALGGLALGGLTGMLLLWPRLRRREGIGGLLLAAGLSALAGAVIFAAYAPFFSARAQASESVEMRSVADRLVFTDFALRSIGERPLLGVGVGNFPWRTSAYIRETFFDLRGDNVHNIYLSAAAELGLIGLALMLLALVSGGMAALRAVRAVPGRPNADRAALLAIVIALLAVGLLDHYPYTTFQMQALLWGCVGGAMGVERSLEQKAQSKK
ncbi:MAG TPA: O-antigen ligase family protein [Candidatus Limnocylindrales bacterium]|nr:O-antigen ligase family protein [Candidatus Limnocylindrales bacterium]